jgi:hypothetical protein
MKLLIDLILVLCCLVITGCAGMGERHTSDMMEIASYQNEPEGFRGIKWGQNIDEIKNMRLISRNNKGLSTYSRSEDVLSLGGAKLIRVRYLFWQKKFFEAQMSAAPDQLQALKRVLNEKYGKGHNPYGPSSTIHDYYWHGPVAIVHFFRTNFMTDCAVTITSREINNQMNNSLKIKAKTANIKRCKKDI